MGGVFAVPVRMMWLLVFAKVCCDNACRLVIAISVVPGPRDNSSCLDARSLTLPRYGPRVGRSTNEGTYVTDYASEKCSIKVGARGFSFM